MSLFVDVIEPLSSALKTSFMGIIENEKKNQDRAIRKVGDVCYRFLDYGELRYDRMEDGIGVIGEKRDPDDPFHVMLLAIMYESLDEDEKAILYFGQLAESSLTKDIQAGLNDFILIGKCITLKHYELLEEAGKTMIQRYSNKENVTDMISNLYLKIDDEQYNSVFQRLVEIAREQHPDHLPLDSLNGYINIKAKNYVGALGSYLKIIDSIKDDTENRYYHFNMAASWDNVAGCYMKIGDADKTIESCDIALDHDSKSETPQTIGDAILHKKAEAFIMKEDFVNAAAILDELLLNNPDDEIATELKSRIKKESFQKP